MSSDDQDRNDRQGFSAVGDPSGLVYCPYTDTSIPETETENWSEDHIVALFMGGDDKFQIRCSRKANNDIGSQVEAPMQNDLPLSLALRNSGIVGRRGTTTVPEWKHSIVDGRKTHITLGADGWKFWDKVEGRYVDHGDREAIPVTTNIKLDIFAPLRLAAKIALGTLVFTFGESIRDKCDLDAFRTIMNMRGYDDFQMITSPTFRVLQRHDPETSQVGSEAFNWKLMVEAFDRTCIIIVPYVEGFGLHIAIAGQHLASFQFDGDTADVPRDGLFDIAHVILLGPGKMERHSLRSVGPKIMERVETLKAAAEASGQ